MSAAFPVLYEYTLPDYYTLFFGEVHLVAFGDAECFKEGLDVAEGLVYTPATETVGVGDSERDDSSSRILPAHTFAYAR